eukprot:GFUD01002077.1.p1 GENE.GFUD01002077.1~~GFUD01002077.1.p1  ORF type:complete len:250 (-),score=80.02 GFUD01002077.1:79-828(-)
MEPSSMRMTRALLLSEHKKIRNMKKVKFDDIPSEEERSMKNLSMVSDEGIDMAFSPLRLSLSIPFTILKPQHPLPNSWSFWYSAGNRHLSWKKNQIKVSTVATIEDFWQTYSQVQPASCLPIGHTYSVFRAEILPDWEDAANMEGGRWMVNCPKVEREDRLDTRWMEMLFMMVGEHTKEFAGLVIGAEACVRKQGDRLEVWVKDVGMMRGVVGVGRMVKSKLGLDTSKRIKFSTHKEDKEGVKGPRLSL